MGVSWYRERIDTIIDGQTVGWTFADKRRLRERFIALRHATLTERNAVETAGRVRVGTSSAPIRSVNAATLSERANLEDEPGAASGSTREARSLNAATLDEARICRLRVSSSAAPHASPPSPRSTP